MTSYHKPIANLYGAYTHERFTVTHTQSEYHFTLYYYDQAGNLVKTVSPAGVQNNTDTTWIKAVEAAKVAGTVMVPGHTLVTNYRYNTLNQVAAQQSPDGGMSNFWYDRLGRLAVSQNRKQLPGNQYSYTQYDTLGRIIQVGQLTSGEAITAAISRNDSTLQLWLGGAGTTANQITVTSYDSGAYAIQPIIGQRNMRNRVSWTALFDTATDLSNGAPNAAAATYYSYDILGNVDTLVQDFGGGVRHSDVANPMNVTRNRFKKISYNFDLVSGKVNQVNYQHGHADAFYHSYLYDAENRITNVQSSTDSLNWDNDAFYAYYAHGPLSRTVIGQQQVQGVNYAYTLQGWLKAINPLPDTAVAFTLRPDSSGTVVANSAYNVMLDYFNGDFNAISGAAGPDSAVSTTLGGDYRPLYNGNISSMGANIRGLNGPLLYNYQYDQLNRLVHMDAWNRTSTPWSAISKTTDFQESVAYDPNGNIQQYRRNGSAATSLAMDSLNYWYKSGTNQLDHITDSVTSTCSVCGDISSQSAGNYQYDSIGELVADAASGITNITWTVYGKIASIRKATGDTTILFTYDPGGNRVSKTVIHAGDTTATWYVRDAQGNILSVYTYGDAATNGKDLTQTELDVYGSSRLGMWRRKVDVEVKPAPPTVSLPLLGSADTLIFTRGNKLFELTNHLGNVLSTISDRRWGVSGNDSAVNYFNPDVVNAQDYYPFGMLEPGVGRQFAQSMLGGYRYGFNGKENDNEVKGVGNEIDYGARVYDPRVGRFLSFDPYFKEYSDLSPYHYAGNNPIQNLDKDGGEPQDYMQNWQPRRFSVNGGVAVFSRNITDPQLGIVDVEAVYDNWTKQTWFIHQGDDGRNYYWKHNPGADQTIRMVGNGKWEEFKTQNRIAYEQTVKLARGMEGFFAGAIVAPFAWAGIAEGGALAWGSIETSSVNAAANAALTYYRLAPAIGAAGKLFAEAFDESGSVMTGGNGGVKLAETIFQEAKGLVGATFKFEGGKALDFLANKVVNGKTLELTDAILYPQGAEGNEMKGEFGKDAVKSILNKLKEYAKSQGFDKLRITYHRAENSSSADPGHVVDKVFDLNK